MYGADHFVFFGSFFREKKTGFFSNFFFQFFCFVFFPDFFPPIFLKTKIQKNTKMIRILQEKSIKISKQECKYVCECK